MLDKKGYKFENLVLAERIFRVLQEAIMEGKLKSGEQLVEMEYQELFNSSRTPIREAFRKLEKLGMVEIIPRKGAFVKSLSARDVEELFPIRASLEGLAAKYAYANRDVEFLSRLQEKTDLLHRYFKENEIILFWKEHNNWHDIVIEGSGNEKLQELLSNLRTQVTWMHITYKYFSEDLKRSYVAHEKIMSMFLDDQTDVNDLERTFRSHIEEVKGSFLAFLK